MMKGCILLALVLVGLVSGLSHSPRNEELLKNKGKKHPILIIEVKNGNGL